jgi:hypothetical protein
LSQLISDLKRLLTDARAVVELVNDDDVIRDLLHHSYDLLRATVTGKGYGPRMPAPAMVENWRMIVASLFTSADVLDMFSAGGLLVHTLHETDEFLVCLSEVVGLMMELLLSVPSQQEVFLLFYFSFWFLIFYFYFIYILRTFNFSSTATYK